MLFLSIAILVSLIGGGAYVVKRISGLESRVQVFEDFFTPEGEGLPSPLGKLIGETGGFVASQVTDGVSKTLHGAIGGSMKGVTAELEQQAVADNPALAIMAGMPKSIKKNPLAMLAMQTLINKNLPLKGGSGGDAIGGNGSYDLVKRNNDSGMYG